MIKMYVALYFRMGMYNSDDDVSEGLIGFDCPFGDSLVIRGSERELRDKIERVFDEPSDFEGCNPDVICDENGVIQVEVYRRLCGEELNLDDLNYSLGRESLTTFWKREKLRWFP